MVPQNQQKVKRILEKLVQRAEGMLAVPEQKFVLEMVMGMLTTGETNLTRIAGSLKEGISVKNTLKRLQRMLSHDHILQVANELSLQAAAEKITDETVLALDGGDIVHQYGRAFEHLAPVYDGSTKETRSGYWLNQVSGYNGSSGETFPILLDIYSTKAAGFESGNVEVMNALDRVKCLVGTKGLWVLDREYDSGIILGHLLKAGLCFMVRMKENRNVLVGDHLRNIREVAEKINRRVNFNYHGRFGSKVVTLLIAGQEYAVTLVSYKDRRNKDIMMLLTSGRVTSRKELKRRIRGYFRRWGVEESYRFEKQGFGIEKATVRRYRGIRTLLGLTLLSWLALIRIKENPRLQAEVKREAKMEKNRKKDQPKFVYYRLLQGVKNLFAGAKRLFLFRWGRKARRRLMKDFRKAYPLFAGMDLTLDHLELKPC